MGEDKKETPSENWTMIGVTPLVILDELKNKVYIESLLELDLELFLHFADDADQVE